MSGWEPRTFTEYEYDDRGRLVGSVSWSEPEWSQADLDAVIAQHLWETSLDLNGIPLDEAMSPEADPANRQGAFYFKAGQHVVNYAEKARLDAEKAFRADNEDANMHGVHFPVVKVERKRN